MACSLLAPRGLRQPGLDKRIRPPSNKYPFYKDPVQYIPVQFMPYPFKGDPIKK